MITTVGDLRAALKDYHDAVSLTLLARGNNCLEQWFPLQSVEHAAGKVMLMIGDELCEDEEPRPITIQTPMPEQLPLLIQNRSKEQSVAVINQTSMGN